ncbi:Hypothetical protein, putative [Bodo saltans]|uniref:Uncharacterized protein n=1 Tax=Bodo saltans TaxID=75058 RepID=A0A0S4KPL0_BODSA|nr:Hypothetical protein, putative [Bodo saltans]|eukprot:CUI15500.1 Hypothetical protein, putative [Bodo saltans]
MSHERTLTAIAVSFDDGKWWYAVPKNQKLGDAWDRCNCTWMTPEPSLPSSFRHPLEPHTPMRWFRHDTSYSSPVHSYARFGVVTFMGTLDPNNDPMTTRWVWGVPQVEDDEMQTLYSQILAREAEDKRRTAIERDDVACEKVVPTTSNEIPALPTVAGQCVRGMRNGRPALFYCPKGVVATNTSDFQVVIEGVFTIVPVEALGVFPRGKFHVVDRSNSCTLRCGAEEIELVAVEWHGQWEDNVSSFEVISISAESKKPSKRQRSDEDRSIADVATSKIVRGKNPTKLKSKPATKLDHADETSTKNQVLFSLDDILKRAGEEKARVAAVKQ